MPDLRTWLENLGLEKYLDLFEREEIDLEVLAELTEAELERLGLPLGPRKKLLRAVAAMTHGAGSPPGSPARGDAERRQLTVMFCDVVGWTALSGSMDPEELRELMRAYQNICAQAIARYDGFLAQFLGDGILAFFGYPRAHEDDAERAVRAARDVLGSAERLGRPGGEPVRFRVGIASGLVVVGDLVGDTTSAEDAVVGETPNLAARLQALAAPGEIVIAHATQRLLRGAFECGDLGVQTLKGIAEPARVWRVESERASLSRYEAAAGKGLAGLVGRNSEVGLLLERWREAVAGEGQVIFLSGEAGIGKSRICAALRDRAAAGEHAGVFYPCSPHHTASPLYPVLRQLEFTSGFASGDDAPTKLAKLLEVLDRSGHAGASETVSLITALLSIPTGDRFPPLDLAPEQQKARTLDALVSMLLGLAARTPVLFVMEDAHWIDPTTQDLIGRAINRLRNSRVLIVVTHRPEYLPPLGGQTHVTKLTLSRLGRQACLQVIANESGNLALPAVVVEQIIEKTDGIPLFVEELTKAVLESGLLRDAGDRYELNGALQPFAIPATLKDALMARLDRLAPVREIAQVGAAIGREFGYGMIAKVLPREESALRDGLRQLEEAELLHRRGEPPDATYIFKHALVQDAAYESLLKARRQKLHAEILAALEGDLAGLAASQPELFAHHASESGQTGKAIAYWQQAGEQALRRGANVEAIKHLRQALAAIGTHPPSAALQEAELFIQSRLGVAHMSVHGWGAPETQASFERAREIGRETGNLPALVAPLLGLWIVNIHRGRLDRGDAASQELFDVARRLGDDGLLLQAHHSAWALHWMRGDFAQAREHVAQGLAIYDEERHADHRILYLNHDPAVCAHSIGAQFEWMSGYPERAQQHELRCLALARRLGHPSTLSTGLWFTCTARVVRGDADAALEHADELLRLCSEAQIVEHVPFARISRGWALARKGQLEEGRLETDIGLALYDASGRKGFKPNLVALGAEVSLMAGRYDEGLERIRSALGLIEEIGEHWAEANARVIHGHLLLHTSREGRAEAEVEFLRALSVARTQGALSLELRAAVALATILGDGGERPRAHALLAQIYARFTEGFATPALQEAKSLLAALV
jgi:class 3 adenylate cyclase/predicted ATPase